MKIRFFGMVIVLITCLTLLLPSFTFAAEDQVVRIKGEVMELNLSKNIVIVNEKTFVWNANSVLYDEKGSAIPITADRLQNGTLVSIEATWIKNKPYTIKNIYLLPPK